MSRTACEPPPPPCKPTNTVELRRIDALIVETERNLARGYTTAPARADGVRVCVGGGGGNVGVSFCSPGNTSRRVAIDPAVERRKLAGLQEKRGELAGISTRELAACEAARRGS